MALGLCRALSAPQPAGCLTELPFQMRTTQKSRSSAVKRPPGRRGCPAHFPRLPGSAPGKEVI